MANNSPLIVPVEVKALLVNDVIRLQSFQRWTMNYQNLISFTSPEPPAFSGNDPNWTTDPKNDGVYLHWTLPDALRHGEVDMMSNQTKFRLVPNRWLVVRYSGPLDSRVALAWVVESDYLNDLDGTSRYIDPRSKTLKPTRLGRCVPLSGWSETNTNPLFLTAVGPGNLSFAAYQPYVANVFSMHDPLSGVSDGEILSYLVAGWYSDPAEDILARWGKSGDFRAWLAGLGWGADDNGDTATSSVYRGMVYGLRWSTTSAESDSGKPSPTDTRLAVGNTSIDALTAMIAQQVQEHGDGGLLDPELLEAFQYDFLRTLDQPDGQLLLDMQIQQAWFGTHPGGYVWEIVDAPPGESPSAAWAAQAAAAGGTPDWLYDLNVAQADYDAAARELAAMRWHLYSVWWKQGKAATLPKYPDGITPQQFKDALDPDNAASLVSLVHEKILAVQAKRDALPWGDTQEALEQAIKNYADEHGLPDTKRLKRSDYDEFWEANDPVVLIYGAKADSLTSAPNPLPCRFPQQVVTGFNSNVGTIDVQSMKGAIPAVDLARVPAIMGALLDEFFFLDPQDATLVASVVLGTSDPDVIKLLSGTMGAYETDIGTVPALQPAPWVQPWSPLFLMWQVTYYPIAFGTNDTPNWIFDGSHYAWTGNGAVTDQPLQMSGRIFLTPQCSFNFKARLHQFLKDNPDVNLQNLADFIKEVDSWDFLSQTLNGFNDILTARDLSSLISPDSSQILFEPGDVTLATLVGSGATAMPEPGIANKPPFQPWPPSRFQQIRSGQFLVLRLMVVDRFGQSVEVVNSQSSLTFKPIIAEGMVPQKYVMPAETYRFVQVPPRLLQPGRLDFYFVSSTDDAHVLNYDADVNPVCAWMLPNHLDRALACYDTHGSALGEGLVIMNEAQQREVSWAPAPGSPYDSFESLSKDYPHLAEFLIGLHDAGPAAFDDLLKVIDETMWATDPPGARDDQYLSVLVGRPLALVRARLQYELDGPPVSDPSWRFTFDPLPPDFLGYDFSVRCGELELNQDGLVGYCAGKDYGQFNSVHVPAGVSSPYVKQIGPENFLKLRFNESSFQYLTMLVDPRAPVHAFTDILPVNSLAVPQPFITSALGNMAVTFRAGPLLSNTQTPAAGGPPQVVLPQPAEKDGTWSWVQLDGATPASFGITPSDQTADFPNTPLVLRTGWLQLAPAISAAPQKKGATMSASVNNNFLLSYAITTDPDPLVVSPAQGNSSSGALTIVVSNNTSDAIYCKQITFSFTIGDLPQDLAGVASGILCDASTDSNWDIAETSDGVFTATPCGSNEITTVGIVFQIYSITVNQSVGTFTLSVVESSSLDDSTFQDKSGGFTLAKFPYGFYLGDLTASVPQVDDGGSVDLTWSGSDLAQYFILYDQQPPVDVTDTRSWPSPKLHMDTTFILQVIAKELGEAVNAYRNVTVTVANPELTATSLTVLKTSTLEGEVTVGTSLKVNGPLTSDSATVTNQLQAGIINGFGVVPVGTVLDWWPPQGSVSQLPSNFRVCDGSLVSDPDSPFNGKELPNLVNRFIRGVGLSDVGQTGGSDSVTPSITIPAGGAHSHALPDATGNVYNGGASLCGQPYYTCDDNQGWGPGVHLRVDGGNSTSEGQHRHALGGIVTGGDHSHVATSGPISTIPVYFGLVKIIRIK